MGRRARGGHRELESLSLTMQLRGIGPSEARSILTPTERSNVSSPSANASMQARRKRALGGATVPIEA